MMATTKESVAAVAEMETRLARSYHAYWTRTDGTRMTATRRRGVKRGLQWELHHPEATSVHLSSTAGLARIMAARHDAYCI